MEEPIELYSNRRIRAFMKEDRLDRKTREKFQKLVGKVRTAVRKRGLARKKILEDFEKFSHAK